ncbi:glycosyltransferase [Myxacorys almedinensis]|uniref:Beta-monoglucosyldiacylglycerol synthase n=1 Tax=Myxacorys almedinensis A TaxID=2690445 RepID=A0A8J8CMB4_9CYAN|nr:glycosyltransferase family 2 protein [Myxacorys almedinensis]NDJ17072.1 glycosyltransferase [Myxacorys almedinensis A]
MWENSWQENDSFNELESLAALAADLPEEVLGELDPPSFRGFRGRRRKAAVVLVVIWSGTIALHLIAWGYWLVLGLTTVMGIHAVRLLFARPSDLPAPLVGDADCPMVSLMVSAKNEEAVVGNLVKMMCSLDYPRDRYELWVINDNSTDNTAAVLDRLAQEYAQLNVFHRSAKAGGGKSGALNQVLPLTQGEIIVVFDADAQVEPDFLRRVLPVFQRETVGAVQVRKAIIQAEPKFESNDTNNFWVRGQMAEMALDAFIHQQRAAIGGLSELRGNGQFVRRQALQACGGWNEETITDDLDLTFRLHLNQWDIEVVTVPPVYEEGVTTALALWHQRNRWAEGGYQRYLDYWRLILKNRMGTRKSLDLFMFWLIQYAAPTAALPDFLMAIAKHRLMLTSPISALGILLFLFSTVGGLRRVQALDPHHGIKRASLGGIDFSRFVALLQALRGTIYMMHWLAIVASTTVRMSIRPKRLKWVKTIHKGNG